MKTPITKPAIARALRRLTGLSLKKSREIVDLAFPEKKPRTMPKQPTLADQPASEEEVRETFAKLRQELSLQ
jgi:hypothetical protein